MSTRHLFSLPLLLISLLSVSACSRNYDSSSEAAVEVAKKRMLSLSMNLKDHVLLDPSKIQVKKVEAALEGGWYVTLAQGTCEYIIYSNPGSDVDVAGHSKGCKREVM